MESMKEIIKIFGMPLNMAIIKAGFYVTTILMGSNFFPQSILEKIKINKFLDSYGSYIPVLWLIFLMIILSEMFYERSQKQKDNAVVEKIKSNQEWLWEQDDAVRILIYLYENQPNAVELPIDNQKVQLLKQNLMIIKTTNLSYMDLEGGMNMRFVLQPAIAEEIKKRFYSEKGKEESNH